MVRIEDLVVGDKVRIVDAWPRGGRQNNGGLMDRYLGTIMTVIESYPDYDYAVMAEDQNDENKPSRGWTWFSEMIDRVLDADDDKEYTDAKWEDLYA